MTIWKPDIEKAQGPRYKAIAQAIAKAIETGALRPGERLPTQRDLAYELNVSVQTVSRAYAEAMRLRLISGEIGRGTFVQYTRPDSISGYILDERKDNAIDFTGMAPFIGSVHLQALRKAFEEISKAEDLTPVLAYRPIAGSIRHREAAAQWLAKQGLGVSVNNVLVTNGGSHGIWTALASLAQPGDVVATEALVESGIITNAAILKLQLRSIEIDDEGIIPEALEEACTRERVRLLCVTPCYSNPTVSLMGNRRREAIAQIARRYDLAIVEDDVYGPLIRNRPTPLWCFAPERTCYVTSFSKAIMQALRTGYVVGPDYLMPRLISRLRSTGWMANTWTAEVATRWIGDGTAAKLVKWQRDRLAKAQAVVREMLENHDYVSRSYAIHVWLRLPGLWRTPNFVEQAKRRGVLVTPPDPFLVGRTSEPHAVRLTIGDACGDESSLRDGLRRLDALLREDPEPSAIGS